MFVVISYDIVSNKKRARMVKLLERYAVRIQKSVFEAVIDEKILMEIKQKTGQIINKEEDSVRFYILCAKCKMTIENIGQGEILKKEDYKVI